MSEKTSEEFAIVGAIDPDANAAAAYSSDYVDMSKFDQLIAIVQTGTLTSGSSTIDAKLQQATSAAGAGVKDITGKAITQVAAASPPTNDQQFIINLKANEVDMDNKFRFVKLVLTVGAAAADSSAVVIARKARYGPASNDDLSSVAQIV